MPEPQTEIAADGSEYVAKVKSDNFEHRGILRDDYLVIRRDDPRPLQAGDIVIVDNDDESIVIVGDTPPTNVVGRVVGLFRSV